MTFAPRSAVYFDWADVLPDVRRLWAAGMSASEIVRELHLPVSRNAVCGKLHRLGLTNADRPQGERRGPRGKPPPPSKAASEFGTRHAPKSKPKPPTGAIDPLARTVGRQGGKIIPLSPAQPLPPEPARVHTADLIPLVALEAHTCKFPIGDPLEPAFGFCGAHKAPERSYCTEHARLAYVPIDPKKAEKNAKHVLKLAKRWA